jgi:tripartite-type tricarboxylate transporter receptor subunit TctC
MHFHRWERRKLIAVLGGAAVAAALPAIPRTAMAQVYPTRPVRVIVPFGSAGATDIVARLIGQWLLERLGQPFVIENRPGAGGNVGVEAVVRSPPDGPTLALIGAPSTINATLYENLNFNIIRDIAPVASIVRFPNVMVVNPSVPARTVPEFIAYAKANPGKLNMSSPGIGSTPHIFGELFKMMAGLELVHVPYRSVAAGLTDMLAGQVQVTFGTTASTIEYVRAGSLRGLAVTSVARSQALPDLPTIAEFLPGYEASAWFGLGAPKNAPDAIIERLNTDINTGLADPKLKARLADLGGVALAGSAADFATLIRDETGKWAKVVKFSGAKVE